MTGLGNSIDSRMIGFVLVTDRVAGRDMLHAANGDDLACASVFDVFALVGVHQHQAADAFFGVLDWVVNVRAGLDRAANKFARTRAGRDACRP